MVDSFPTLGCLGRMFFHAWAVWRTFSFNLKIPSVDFSNIGLSLKNILAHQLCVISATIIYSYMNSINECAIFATAHNVRRGFLRTVQNIFAHQLGISPAAIMISYTTSSDDGLIFDTTRSTRCGFFANRAKYFRSPAGCYFNNENNFLYDFKWRWLIF